MNLRADHDVLRDTSGDDTNYDAIIIGAGFAGMYMLHKSRQLGLKVLVIEAGNDVGGTWYWNRYPGARCDVPSIDYSYSFSAEIQQEWSWREKFAPQPEILAYANFVADKLDLRRDIRFATRLIAARYCEQTGRWELTLDTGEKLDTQYLVMATGCLSVPKAPGIPGVEDFKGEVYYSALWPHHAVSFSGKRLSVIGTGSTGIQIIPEVAKEAESVTVFQRTPSFTLPARNVTLSDQEIAALKRDYDDIRRRARESTSGGTRPLTNRKTFSVSEEERQEIYERMWREGGITFGGTFGDLVLDEEANKTAADFVRNKISEIVEDPTVAEALKPHHYPIGARRICLDTNFYETFNQPHVTLVNAKDTPIERVTSNGIIAGGTTYEADAIIFATGFDAMTGALLRVEITGRNGLSLREKWADGPKAMLGLMMAGFPNLFTITGPGSPSVLSNMIASIEQHVEWIADCIAYLRQTGHGTIEPTTEAEDAWVSHVATVGEATLMAKANSWYTGTNVPGKPRVFMPYVGGLPAYRAACEDIAANDYRGFSKQKVQALGARKLAYEN